MFRTPRRLQCASFFFNDTATTEIYTLSLHDALPISRAVQQRARHVEADAVVLDTCIHPAGAGRDHDAHLSCVRVLTDVRERFLDDADERDLLGNGHAGEVSLDALLHRNAGSLREGCDLVGDHAWKRPPDEAARLERVGELPEHTV